jgi:hypothetical protein
MFVLQVRQELPGYEHVPVFIPVAVIIELESLTVLGVVSLHEWVKVYKFEFIFFTMLSSDLGEKHNGLTLYVLVYISSRCVQHNDKSLVRKFGLESAKNVVHDRWDRFPAGIQVPHVHVGVIIQLRLSNATK